MKPLRTPHGMAIVDVSGRFVRVSFNRGKELDSTSASSAIT